jgi:tetratricopeptide (TPR) repeat protein
MALAMEGKNDEALAAFQEVVRIEPEMAPGYLNLAIHLERMKRFPEALRVYEKFMDLSSDDGFARERAVAHAAIKRLKGRQR